VFEGYFNQRGIPFEGTDFSGRSDYGLFIAVNIPSGGLFTGAEGIKTAAQAALFGGTAGVAYDPCITRPATPSPTTMTMHST
jgi:Zn-dependent M28 family amino/carboxypeptidase